MSYEPFARVLLPILILVAAAPVAAQVARERVERAQDRQQLRPDDRALRDDVRDVVRLETLMERFEHARGRGDRAALDAVDRELKSLLAGELEEGSRESRQSEKAARQGQGGIRGDRREIRKKRVEGVPKRVRVDERRDLRDDGADAAGERRQNRTRAQLAQDWKVLVGRHDPASLDEKHRILEELVTMARHEVAGGAQEKAEDRRELREDRRETREDRRQKG